MIQGPSLASAIQACIIGRPMRTSAGAEVLVQRTAKGSVFLSEFSDIISRSATATFDSTESLLLAEKQGTATKVAPETASPEVSLETAIPMMARA
jgi:hypothetical protein